MKINKEKIQTTSSYILGSVCLMFLVFLMFGFFSFGLEGFVMGESSPPSASELFNIHILNSMGDILSFVVYSTVVSFLVYPYLLYKEKPTLARNMGYTLWGLLFLLGVLCVTIVFLPERMLEFIFLQQ